MILQKMPGPGLCLPTSFAMALEIPVQSLLAQLPGHQAVIFSGLPTPLCWRGLHIQELIRVAQSYGYAVTPREMFPQIAAPRPGFENYIVTYENDTNEHVFGDVILLSHGVVTGVRGVPGLGLIGHAVAYDHGILYDPNGLEYAYEAGACEACNFFPQCAWRVDRFVEVA